MLRTARRAPLSTRRNYDLAFRLLAHPTREVTRRKLLRASHACLASRLVLRSVAKVSAVVATHNKHATCFVSIGSKLHLPPRENPIILARKSDAGPVGVGHSSCRRKRLHAPA